MAIMTVVEIFVMCIAPAVMLFLCVGVISIGKHAKAWWLRKSEEVDHEL